MFLITTKSLICSPILSFNYCLAFAHIAPWAYSYQLHWTMVSSLYVYVVPLLFIITLLLPAYLLCRADSWLANVSAFYDLVPKAGTSNGSDSVVTYFGETNDKFMGSTSSRWQKDSYLEDSQYLCHKMQDFQRISGCRYFLLVIYNFFSLSCLSQQLLYIISTYWIFPVH